VRLEGVEALALEDALGLVGEQHRVAVEGDAHLVRMRVRGPRRMGNTRAAGTPASSAERTSASLVDRNSCARSGAGSATGSAPRVKTPRSMAAVLLGRAEDAHARDRVVARQDHDLHQRRRIPELQQLAHERDRRRRGARDVQARELQLHVGAVVAGLEDAGSLLRSRTGRARRWQRPGGRRGWQASLDDISAAAGRPIARGRAGSPSVLVEYQCKCE
jgi:hypothetical protein